MPNIGVPCGNMSGGAPEAKHVVAEGPVDVTLILQEVSWQKQKKPELDIASSVPPANGNIS